MVCEQIHLNCVDSLGEKCLNIVPLEASLDGTVLSCFTVLIQPASGWVGGGLNGNSLSGGSCGAAGKINLENTALRALLKPRTFPWK